MKDSAERYLPEYIDDEETLDEGRSHRAIQWSEEIEGARISAAITLEQRL